MTIYHFADRARWAVISILPASPARDRLVALPMAAQHTVDEIVSTAMAAQPARPLDDVETPEAELARAQRRAVEALIHGLGRGIGDPAEASARAVAAAAEIAATIRGETPHQIENAREDAWSAERAYQGSLRGGS